jgi:hypothetical protein
MTNMTVFSGANLPAVSSLTTALRGLQTNAGNGSGELFLKFDKTGHWVFGSEGTEVEKDSLWAVNPYSFMHGFIAWGGGVPLGERMAPVTQPLPETGPAPEGAERGWETQVSVSMKCIEGEDEGIDVRWSATSQGGKKALHALAMAVADQCVVEQGKDDPQVIAVVTLGRDTYKHKKYGTIQTPLLIIDHWLTLSGEVAKADEPEVVEEPTPTRRRRA